MRLAFFVLLFINVILFAVGQGYWGEQATGREPDRLQRQIEPEKLRIVSAVTTANAATASAAPAARVDAARICKRVEWLSTTESTSIEKAAAEFPGWEVSRIPRQEAPVHWVVIPELLTRALAEKKKAELRQLGITEGEIVEHATLGPYAVSLGVFRGPSLAEEFLQLLAKKGVRSARLIKRELPAEKFALELRAPADELNKRLPDWMTPLTGINLIDCAKP
jgi:hypothetical protein